MNKQDWATVRIKEKLINKINAVLGKNDNCSYCSSAANFVQVAVIQLLEDVEKKKSKIRWGKNE